MSQTKIKQECRAILEVMGLFHQGGSIDDINEKLQMPIPRLH